MNKFMSFLSGLIFGAAVGAAAAALWAPASGQELQTQTRDWFDGLIHDARQAAADRRADLEAQLVQLKGTPVPPAPPKP